MQRVYLDNAATTPLFPQVAEKMADYLTHNFGNPSSLHSFGREVRADMDKARNQAAELINAKEGEIFFTSGGTEADNLAILGTAQYKGKGHIITSKVEHHAVLHACEALDEKNYAITYLPVDEYGMVKPDTLKAALRPDTILVSIMQGNNEMGTINPIKELAAIAKEGGALFHTDAVQSVGKIPVDVEDLGVDLLVYSGHKINGPKGIGVLYKRRGVVLKRLFYGGGQEKKLRPGTENLPGIVGLGLAAQLTRENMAALNKEWLELRDYFIKEALAKIPHLRLNGHPKERLPHNINLSFNYIEGEALLLHLDLNGIACSAGSACSSASLEPSHVLKAMGLAPEWSQSSLRFSLGLGNTREEIDYTIKVLAEKVALLRSHSPFYKG